MRIYTYISYLDKNILMFHGSFMCNVNDLFGRKVSDAVK